MSEDQEKKGAGIFKRLLIIVFIVIVAIIVWLIFRGESSYNSTGTKVTKVTSIDCSNSHPENPFFVSSTAQRFTHRVKATFKDDRINDIAYNYDGTYNSTETAESANAHLHAEYNTYMGSNDQYQEGLMPNFATTKSKLKISLFAKKDQINHINAVFFFLNPDDVRDADFNYTIKKLKAIYENQGFSCEVYE